MSYYSCLQTPVTSLYSPHSELVIDPVCSSGVKSRCLSSSDGERNGRKVVVVVVRLEGGGGGGNDMAETKVVLCKESGAEISVTAACSLQRIF